MRKTLKNILAEYGAIAVAVYLVLFTLVLVGSYFAIRLGWTPGSTAGQAGAWTAAYIVTKIAQPLRIAATVVITTFLGRMWERRKGPTEGAPPA
jgi:lipopolysaccharide export LptBFGC system permease protein LptF